MPAPVDFKYRAFLSYAHADARWGKWLHKQLEGFRIDYDLAGRETARGRVPTTLRPIFRDREDFSGGHPLTDATIAALDQSAALIVLCSTIAATRPAVNEEVRLFRWRHPDRLVIPVIIEGTHPSSFPPALRFEIGADGSVTDRPVTILGADLRETADGSALGLAKIVAGLVGVGTDEIVRRAEREQRRRLRNWIVGLSSLVVVLTGLTAWAEINRREAVAQRVRAEQTTAVASNAANDLIFKIAERFKERQGVPQSLVMAILQQAQHVIGQLSELGAPRADVVLGGATAFAEISTAFRQQGQYEEALAAAERAISGFQRLVQMEPGKVEGRFGLATGFDRKGEALRAVGRTAEAVVAFESSRDIALALLAEGPTTPARMRNAAVGLEKTGEALLDAGKLDAAIQDLQQSRQLRVRLLTLKDAPELRRELAISHERLAAVHAAKSSPAAALVELTKSLDLTRQVAETDPARTDWQRDLAVIHQHVGNLHRAERRLADALPHYREQTRISWRLVHIDPDRDDWQLDAARSGNQLGAALLEAGDLAGAADNFRKSLAAFTKTGSDRLEWQRAGFTAASDLGDALRQLKKVDESLSAFEKSRVIAEQAVKASSGPSEFDRRLVFVVHREAEALLSLQQRDAALVAHKNLVKALRQIGMQRKLSDLTLADALGNLAWYAILAGKLADALQATTEAVQIGAALAWIETNHAHALMMSGRLDEARAAYRKLARQPPQDLATWASSVRSDFRVFREMSILTPLMEEIEAMLP
jgi:tetratricopeptide (TPR) repeat protein